MVWDLNKFPYPFKQNTFVEILMKSILEHLDNPKRVMEEIYRISKPGAIIHIRVPHFSSIHAWGDIEHKRGYSMRTFIKQNISKNFKMKKRHLEISHSKFFLESLANKHPIFYEKYLAYIFTANDIVVELEVIK